MQLSPIALFVYNRLWHTQQTLEALKKNALAKESDLFIFSDSPRGRSAERDVEKVREYVKTINGFKNITIIESSKNLGPAKAIISGVTQVVTQYGKIIVLEDDLIVSSYFLKFMNDALLFYEKEEKVISICGYMYPINIESQETVFFRIPDCWGWATWKRGWGLFEPDQERLLSVIMTQKKAKEFDLGGVFLFTRMLKKQIRGKINSWAIQWYASAFLQGKLSLYPWKSLVRNIGFDYSGTHCGFMTGYDAGILEEPVLVKRIPIVEDSAALENIGIFFKSKQRDIFNRIINKTVGFFRKWRYNRKSYL